MALEKITAAHGAGGSLTWELIRKVFDPHFGVSKHGFLDAVSLPTFREVTVTADSFTVYPYFFPGGDVGKLAVVGTANDLAVCGASPLYLALCFVIPEGFPIGDLKKIAESVARWARKVGFEVVCGDTKVVEGNARGITISAFGVGKTGGLGGVPSLEVSPGDAVIVTGPVGAHEAAILVARESYKIEGEIVSDCGPIVEAMRAAFSVDGAVRFARDPTRGGLATALNEAVAGKPYGIRVRERDIPVPKQVEAVARMLGMSPLYFASEGQAVMIVEKGKEKNIVEELVGAGWKYARKIGEVTDEFPGMVVLETKIGAERVLPMIAGTQFPRIC